MGTERDEIDDELDALIAERKAQTAAAEPDPDIELAARLAPTPAPAKPKAAAPVAPRGTTAPPRRDGVAPNVSVVPTPTARVMPTPAPSGRSLSNPLGMPPDPAVLANPPRPQERVTPLGQAVVDVLKQPFPMPTIPTLASLDGVQQRNQEQIDAWKRAQAPTVLGPVAPPRKPLGPERPPAAPAPAPASTPAPPVAAAAPPVTLEEAKRALVEADLIDASMVDAMAQAAPDRIMAAYMKLQSRGK